MSFGLSGPSSSGKSTLARDVAKLMDMPYWAFPTAELVAELGLSPVAAHGIEDRLKVQEHLLKRFWEISQALPRPFISDRTPIDIMSYMLCDVGMHSCSAEIGAKIIDFSDRCLWTADQTYMAVFTLRALPVFDVTAGRPPPNRAYHRHFEIMCEGAAMRLRFANDYNLIVQKHEDRVSGVTQAIRTELAAAQIGRDKILVC